MKSAVIYVIIGALLCGDVIKNAEADYGTTEDLAALMDNLFTNYSKSLRPVRNLNASVTVHAEFFLFSILDIDEVAGTILLSGGIDMYWNDSRLQWNSTEYGGIVDIKVTSSILWKPSVFLVSDWEKFGSDDFDASIYNTGLVSFSPGKLMKSSCAMNPTKFPMDSQNCTLLLSTWSYSGQEIELSAIRSEFKIDYFSPNGVWNVDETNVGEDLRFGPGSAVLVLNIYLTRRSAYLMMTMVIPICLLCFLNPFVFLLPASSGERISYTVTMFLSLAVYMTIIGDNIPNVAEPVAEIAHFMLFAIFYSCVIIGLTICTLGFKKVSDARKFAVDILLFIVSLLIIVVAILRFTLPIYT